MRTPSFWKEKDSFLAKSLFLPSKIFEMMARINAKIQKNREYSPKLTVICVGNVTVGGAGKTPIAIAIAKMLLNEQKKVAFLSRGYKGRLDKVVVDSNFHTASDVGDEPLLLCNSAPVIVSKNRAEGAKIAEKMGIDFLIMDDGFQNFTIRKDISILVFDGVFGIGNGLILPAGPMREKLDNALARADFVVISNEDKTGLGKIITKPILKGEVQASEKKLETLKKKRLLAFAGIGRPEKFLETLEKNCLDIVSFLPYPDHYCYKEKDLNYIFKKASEQNAEIITTSKDWVKIPKNFQSNIDYLPIDFYFKDDTVLLKEIIGFDKHFTQK